jgi:hypothetical protein
MYLRNFLYPLGVLVLWFAMLVIVTLIPAAVAVMVMPDSMNLTTKLIASFGTSLIFGVLLLAGIIWSTWKHWTINPDNLEIWYTKDDLLGFTRFYKQGLNLKFPWETRVTNDSHKGVIALHRTLSEEASGQKYTAKDNAVILFGWKFEWWPHALCTDGSINVEGCERYIKTDNATKSDGLRSRLDRLLTTLAINNTSETLRFYPEFFTSEIAYAFGPNGEQCEEERNYGILVNAPIFTGVNDTQQVEDARTTAKTLQVIAQGMGMPAVSNDPTQANYDPQLPTVYKVDDSVLVAAKLAGRNELKVTGENAHKVQGLIVNVK